MTDTNEKMAELDDGKDIQIKPGYYSDAYRKAEDFAVGLLGVIAVTVGLPYMRSSDATFFGWFALLVMLVWALFSGRRFIVWGIFAPILLWLAGVILLFGSCILPGWLLSQ